MPTPRLIAALAAVLLLAASPLAAAEAGPRVALSDEGPVSGPVLGYFFDPAELKLRPIHGIPGASTIGAPVTLNVDLQAAVASPAGDYALGVDAAGVLYRVALRNGVGLAEPVTGAITGVDRIFLSPSADAAAIYDRQGRTVQVLSGLHQGVETGGVIELTGVDGVITALAAADDGRTILIGAATREGGAIYTAAPGVRAERVAPAGQVVSLAFLPGSSDALAADVGRSEVLSVTGLGRAASARVIASGAHGLQRPMAVASAGDGQSALILSANSSEVIRVPLSGGPPERIACACTPQTLTPMGAAFRLTDNPAQPLYMLEIKAGAEPRMLFTPALSGQTVAATKPARVSRGR